MYRSMIKMYYRGVAVTLIVYDVGDRASFECIGDWIKDVREKQQQRVLGAAGKGQAAQECLYYVIGNKADLDDDEREVSYEEGEQWVKEYQEEQDDDIDMKFLEVSAKLGSNINALFEEVSIKLLERHNKVFGKGKVTKVHDPSQLLSYNYNQQKIESGQGGPGRNRIEIVDINGEKKREKDQKKDDSCCKSC